MSVTMNTSSGKSVVGIEGGTEAGVWALAVSSSLPEFRPALPFEPPINQSPRAAPQRRSGASHSSEP